MSRPGIEPWPPQWEASTPEKNHSNSLLIAIRNIYIRSRDNDIYLVLPMMWDLMASEPVRRVWLSSSFRMRKGRPNSSKANWPMDVILESKYSPGKKQQFQEIFT
jgi:hypothetical protein